MALAAILILCYLKFTGAGSGMGYTACSPGAGYINGVDILADGGYTYPLTVPQIE